MNEYKQIIDESISEINKQLPQENSIDRDIDFEILGSNSNFDSMAIINFILFIEEKIKFKYKKNLNLLNSVMEQIDHEKKYRLSDLYNDIDKKIKNK